MKRYLAGVLAVLMAGALGVSAYAAGDTATAKETAAVRVELTEEQKAQMKAQMDEMKAKMEAQQAAFAALSDSQKDAIYDLQDEMAALQGKMADLYASYGILTTAEAAEQKSAVVDAAASARQDGKMPGMMFARGGKKMGMAGKMHFFTDGQNATAIVTDEAADAAEAATEAE